MLDNLGISDEDWTWTLAELVWDAVHNQRPELDESPSSERDECLKIEKEAQAYLRNRLDSDDLGAKIFAICKSKENDDDFVSRQHGRGYKTIILGAMMMTVGVKISAEDLAHLRTLVPGITCNMVYTSPLGDGGFRGPGRAQFLAALDHYQAGTPRSFFAPSCFHCGKIEADLGHQPLKCAKCRRAWYCNKICQRAHWKYHKHSCASRDQVMMLNI